MRRDGSVCVRRGIRRGKRSDGTQSVCRCVSAVLVLSVRASGRNGRTETPKNDGVGSICGCGGGGGGRAGTRGSAGVSLCVFICVFDCVFDGMFDGMFVCVFICVNSCFSVCVDESVSVFVSVSCGGAGGCRGCGAIFVFCVLFSV